MKAVVFTTHPFEQQAFERAREKLGSSHSLTYVPEPLTAATAEAARGHDVVIPFVNDRLDAAMLRQLAGYGVKLIALRAAGHNNLDLAAAKQLGLASVYVPSYTPHAVAEHVFALTLSLSRFVPRAVNRVREGNFDIDGLIGTLIAGRTFGVVGLGRIGKVVAGIAEAFGCKVLYCDHHDAGHPAWERLSLDELLSKSHVVSLHVPLTPDTKGLIDSRRLALLPDGALLVNTSRGPVVDSAALVEELKRDRLGGVALDVYDREAEVFYVDHSGEALQDDVLARLLTFPKVIVTSHMGFMTWDSLGEIVAATLQSMDEFAQGLPLTRAVP